MRKELVQLAQGLTVAALIGGIALGVSEARGGKSAPPKIVRWKESELLDTSLGITGLLIAAEVRNYETLPPHYASELSRLQWHSQKLKGNLSDTEESARLNQDDAVLGAVMALQNALPPKRMTPDKLQKVREVRSYALKIFSATGFTREELAGLSDEKAAYLLLLITREAKKIYSRVCPASNYLF